MGESEQAGKTRKYWNEREKAGHSEVCGSWFVKKDLDEVQN